MALGDVRQNSKRKGTIQKVITKPFVDSVLIIISSACA